MSNRIYERAFFTVLQSLVTNYPRLAPSHMRKELIDQAHTIAIDVVTHFEKVKEDEVRCEMQDLHESI